jgi:hypothetical protein
VPSATGPIPEDHGCHDEYDANDPQRVIVVSERRANCDDRYHCD